VLSTLVPKGTVEPYVFWRLARGVRSEAGTFDELAFQSVGVRWVGKLPANFDYNEDVFQQLFLHLSPAPIELGGKPLAIQAPWLPALFTLDSNGHDTGQLGVTNLQVFQVVAVLIVLIGFSGVASHLRTGRGDAWSRMFAGFVGYVRDEMVYPVMGREHGRRFVPYFLCIFFFIMFMNLFGLLPGAATATASIAVTGALALTTFGAMLGCGMLAQGPIAFWKNLVPHVPLALWPLMFLVELMGLIVKPVALTIRLFANMTAGHLIVLSCMGLIMFFAGKGSNPLVGWGSSPLAVGFAVFVMIVETFVALLQAYIFTTLSIIFVGAAVHPEH
jgi:F-type H+-transporting ATPase subunit a